MFKSLSKGVLLVTLFAAPAFANHCPTDAKAIDIGLMNIQLSDEQKTEIMALRDEGMALHNAGNHQDALATLAKAMRMLLEATQM